MAKPPAEIISDNRPVLILDDLRFKRGKREAIAGVSGVFRQGDLSIIHGGAAGARSLLARLITGQLPPDSGQIWRDGRAGPLIGFMQGFNVGGPALRGLELRAAAYGVRFWDYVDEIATYLRNPDIMRKQMAKISGPDRAALLYASAYVLPCTHFVSEQAPLPVDEELRERLTPLYERARARAAIICITRSPKVARQFDNRRILRFREGQLIAPPRPGRRSIAGPAEAPALEAPDKAAS